MDAEKLTSSTTTPPSRKWPRKNYIMIGVAVVVIITAVVLGVTLSHKNNNPAVIGTAGNDLANLPAGVLSANTRSIYWGDELDLTCPKGEYITTIYGYKYIATLPGLAAQCSGGSKVGDKEIINKLSEDKTQIQSITSTDGSKVLYFYLPYIYETDGDTLSSYHYPAGISFKKLIPATGVPTAPVSDLVGTYGGNSVVKEIKSVNNITGVKIVRGTTQSDPNKAKPCICDTDPTVSACTTPGPTTLKCHTYPRIGVIDVYA